ncbi:MAG: Cytochrome c oxidase polypeptide III, partial [uncultured Phycisphaerae bacterium]
RPGHVGVPGHRGAAVLRAVPRLHDLPQRVPRRVRVRQPPAERAARHDQHDRPAAEQPDRRVRGPLGPDGQLQGHRPVPDRHDRARAGVLRHQGVRVAPRLRDRARAVDELGRVQARGPELPAPAVHGAVLRDDRHPRRPHGGRDGHPRRDRVQGPPGPVRAEVLHPAGDGRAVLALRRHRLGVPRPDPVPDRPVRQDRRRRAL